jgi:hypothetical protein
VSYQGNNRLADSDWSSHGSRGGVHDALTWEYPEVQRRCAAPGRPRTSGFRIVAHGAGSNNLCANKNDCALT